MCNHRKPEQNPMHDTGTNRREFARQAVAGVASVGAAACLTSPSAAQDANRPARKTRIRLGVRFNEAWLASKNDDDLKLFKQLGVDWVDIELKLIKGYAEHGVFTKADLQAFIERLDACGLKI